jgi:integrase
MTKLTDIAIRNLKPAAKRREIPDPGARGLYIIVQPSGVKSFAVRYRFGGLPRKHTLTPGISLAAARKAAATILHDVEQGHDPRAARRKQKEAQIRAAADTFEAIAEHYFRLEGHKIRTGNQRRRDLNRLVYPVLGNQPIAEIRRSDIVRLLDRIEENNGPVQADRTLAAVRKILNWHAVRSDDFRSPIVRGMARTNGQERARTRTLTDDEIRKVWQTAETTARPFSRLIQILLLTSARRNEAARMSWDELSGADWTLPAARNQKTKLDLVRPLSGTAQRILAESRVVGCKFVFTHDGRRALGSYGELKARFDKACGVSGWTLHDLRRTARSLMSRAGVNPDHAERCLGHVIGGVRGVYDRHEFYNEKRHAFEALAALIARIVDPRPNVVAMVGG